MLIAQKKLRAESGKKFDKDENSAKLKEKYASMTPEQQKAFKAKWSMMKKDDDDKKDGFMKDDMSMRAKAGYFKKMGEKERGMFDKKIAAFKKDRDDDDNDFKTKMMAMKQKAGFDKMDAAKKMAWMKEKMSDRKDEVGRKEGWRNEDMDQRSKAGYFMKMNSNQRDVYDKMEMMMKKKRMADDKEWDGKRDSQRKAGGWDSMTADKKKAFMMKFGKERGAHMK